MKPCQITPGSKSTPACWQVASPIIRWSVVPISQVRTMALGINSRKFWKLGVKREVPQFINTDRKGEKKTKQWFRHRNWRFWRFGDFNHPNHPTFSARLEITFNLKMKHFWAFCQQKNFNTFLLAMCNIMFFFAKSHRMVCLQGTFLSCLSFLAIQVSLDSKIAHDWQEWDTPQESTKI